MSLTQFKHAYNNSNVRRRILISENTWEPQTFGRKTNNNIEVFAAAENYK